MQHFIEKTLLTLFCLVLLLPNFPINHCVLACLSILALSSFTFYTSHSTNTLAAFVLTAVLIWFLPALGIFLPITAYDTTISKLSARERAGSFASIGISLLLLYPKFPIYLWIVLLLLVPAAALIGQKSSLIGQLRKTIRKNRDTDRELQLLLEQKNAELLQRSHYEIEMATLRERNRIAKEIHDNVGHLLTRSILQVGALHTINKDTACTPYYEQLQRTLNQAMDTIRASVHNLYHPGNNLHASIESFIRNISHPQIQLHYRVEQISQDIAWHLLAIIKEAVNNTIRHSNADHLQITLLEHPQFYQLVIADNGSCAPDPFSLPRSSHSGMGLSSMQERILSLHGTMEIFTQNGFKLFMTVPKNLSDL